MGTSASYSAPPSWGDLKKSLTLAADRAAIPPQRAQELVSSFVQHNGGANAIARGGGRGGGGGAGVAKGGNARSTATRLGGFLSSVGHLGLTGALQAAGWGDLVGRPTREILSSLLDRLGGESSTIDDVDARMALAALEKQYFGDPQTAEELEALMREQVGRIESVLQDFFGLYLYEVFCRVFFERLVQSKGETRAYSVLDQIKDFIRATLDNLAADRDLSAIDWTRREGQRITSEIMESTLRVFE
jgi:hypothetical protein